MSADTAAPAALTLPGELTIFVAAELHSAWLPWLASDAGKEDEVLRLDASAVAEADSAGVQLLMSLANGLARRGRSLQLMQASNALRSACEHIGATQLLDQNLLETTP